MPKILVNYTYNKSEDKFTIINDSVVYADLPIAIMERYQQIEEPFVVPMQNKAVIVEKKEFLKVNKLYKFKVLEDGRLEESEEGTLVQYLPKENLDISKLRCIEGKIYLIDDSKGGNE